MEEQQVQKLKLTVTNIKSVLVNSNNELRKLRVQRKNLLDSLSKKQKQKSKEEKLEGKVTGLSTLKNIGQKIISGPMSLFDKILEFAGIILIGILVNNLPTIIDKIKNFFSENAWWIKGILEIGKFIGKGVLELVKIIGGFDSNKIENDRKSIDQDLDKLKKSLSDVESGKNKIDKAINSKKSAKGSPPLIAPGSMYPASPQGHAKGGPVSQSTRLQTQKTTGPVSNVGETGRAKRARQTTNYFGTFNESVKKANENTVLEEENMKLFEKMANNFKKVLEGMDSKSPHAPYGRRGPGSLGSTPGAPAVPVNPDEVVAYSGGVRGLLSSGNSRGEHIHMENGDGYDRPGGAIPSDVLQNVLVNGRPINSYGTSRDPSTGHEGYDFQTAAGLPVTLTGGLKFVEYDAATSADTNAGFGDSLIIMDSRGKKYLLGHMSGGPKDPQAIKDKQNKAIQNIGNFQVKQKISGKQASWYGPGFYGNKTKSGEVYTGQDLTAAMNNVPFGTRVRVTNANNGKSVVVRINDRGPFEPDKVTPHRSRIIDLSERAAKVIDLTQSGVAPVTVEILEPKKGINPNLQSSLLPNLTPMSPGENSQSVLLAVQPIERIVPIPTPYPVVQESKKSTTPPVLSQLWTS